MTRPSFTLGSFVFFREEPGVISEDAIWVCFHECWMYTGDTLPKLLWEMARHWKSDRNLLM